MWTRIETLRTRPAIAAHAKLQPKQKEANRILQGSAPFLAPRSTKASSSSSADWPNLRLMVQDPCELAGSDFPVVRSCEQN